MCKAILFILFHKDFVDVHKSLCEVKFFKLFYCKTVKMSNSPVESLVGKGPTMVVKLAPKCI